MKAIFKKDKIKTYKNDINKLNRIKKIYEFTKNLYGAFYTDFMKETDGQIEHLKECINNLKLN